MHTLSLILDPTSPVSHKGRKSSTSSILSTSPCEVDRCPKKGDEDYINCPENAFILFRRKCVEDRDAAAASNDGKKQRQADLSEAISQQWEALSGEERKHWEDSAKGKKEHEFEDRCGEEPNSTTWFVILPPATLRPFETPRSLCFCMYASPILRAYPASQYLHRRRLLTERNPTLRSPYKDRDGIVIYRDTSPIYEIALPPLTSPRIYLHCTPHLGCFFHNLYHTHSLGSAVNIHSS
ncbi:slightly ste11-like protein [Marasmius sp. AFHP31]|nr:slightly ste11-like protein [Marasmius sp. AFHP31]